MGFARFNQVRLLPTSGMTFEAYLKQIRLLYPNLPEHYHNYIKMIYQFNGEQLERLLNLEENEIAAEIVYAATIGMENAKVNNTEKFMSFVRENGLQEVYRDLFEIGGGMVIPQFPVQMLTHSEISIEDENGDYIRSIFDIPDYSEYNLDLSRTFLEFETNDMDNESYMKKLYDFLSKHPKFIEQRSYYNSKSDFNILLLIDLHQSFIQIIPHENNPDEIVFKYFIRDDVWWNFGYYFYRLNNKPTLTTLFIENDNMYFNGILVNYGVTPRPAYTIDGTFVFAQPIYLDDFYNAKLDENLEYVIIDDQYQIDATIGYELLDRYGAITPEIDRMALWIDDLRNSTHDPRLDKPFFELWNNIDIYTFPDRIPGNEEVNLLFPKINMLPGRIYKNYNNEQYFVAGYSAKDNRYYLVPVNRQYYGWDDFDVINYELEEYMALDPKGKRVFELFYPQEQWEYDETVDDWVSIGTENDYDRYFMRNERFQVDYEQTYYVEEEEYEEE